jgi:hypothetical protein
LDPGLDQIPADEEEEGMREKFKKVFFPIFGVFILCNKFIT